MDTTIPPAVLRAVERSLGGQVTWVEPIARGGHTSALARRIALADDGRTFILKTARDRLEGEWLRTEQRVYRHLTGQRFLPGLIEAGSDGHRWLLLEDLGHGGWPPPWPPGGITAVRDMLDAVHVAPVPPGIGPVHEASPVAVGWRIIDADPLPLLHAGVDDGWLERYLPTLIEASRPELIQGGALLHMDVRAENIRLTPRGAVLVDWTSARTGHPAVDLALWLPSLAMDTGQRPDDLAPDLDPGFAVLAAGFYANLVAGSHADVVAELYDHADPAERKPVPLRVDTQVQLIVALAWAARTLGIPAPPRGPGRRR